MTSLLILLLGLALAARVVGGGVAGPNSEYAKALFDDLMSHYNPLIRPVPNKTDRLTVKMGLRLDQLVDVNMKSQIMTTKMWIEQVWEDYLLHWDPDAYAGTTELYVPPERIWTPDIVLFNNADGVYEPNTITKATVYPNGKVVWKIPAIYKSYCEMNVQWFPFDEQTCDLRFGSWTYHADEVDLSHIDQTPGNNVVGQGMQLMDYIQSVEWDLLGVPAQRNMEYYPCCEEPYVDITFQLVLRRKIVFYTVNLILPLAILCSLTILVFYLPCDSGEKVSLAINILVSVSWFFFLLNEISPPTSQAIPLIGRYLLFTASLVSTSVLLAVFVLRIHFRGNFSETMPGWITTTFLEILPTVLCMKRPQFDQRLSAFKPKNREDTETYFQYSDNDMWKSCVGSPNGSINLPSPPGGNNLGGMNGGMNGLGGLGGGGVNGGGVSPTPKYSPEVVKAIESVEFIAKNISDQDKQKKGAEDWKYAAMVVDRLFFWVFIVSCTCGVLFILLLAPALTDRREPVNEGGTALVGLPKDHTHLITTPTGIPLNIE